MVVLLNTHAYGNFVFYFEYFVVLRILREKICRNVEKVNLHEPAYLLGRAGPVALGCNEAPR